MAQPILFVLGRADHVFCFPRQFVYSYASMTAPSHRGNKLERERWKAGRAARKVALGADIPSIWYINVTNLESRAAHEHAGPTWRFHGYTGYVELFGSCYVFSSRRCRRIGVGFARADTDA